MMKRTLITSVIGALFLAYIGLQNEMDETVYFKEVAVRPLH